VRWWWSTINRTFQYILPFLTYSPHWRRVSTPMVEHNRFSVQVWVILVGIHVHVGYLCLGIHVGLGIHAQVFYGMRFSVQGGIQVWVLVFGLGIHVVFTWHDWWQLWSLLVIHHLMHWCTLPTLTLPLPPLSRFPSQSGGNNWLGSRRTLDKNYPFYHLISFHQVSANVKHCVYV